MNEAGPSPQQSSIILKAIYAESELADAATIKPYLMVRTARFAYATNGQGIYTVDMQTGDEVEAGSYPSPDELWARTFAQQDAWRDRFAAVSY